MCDDDVVKYTLLKISHVSSLIQNFSFLQLTHTKIVYVFTVDLFVEIYTILLFSLFEL